jgi:hypothetical protein
MHYGVLQSKKSVLLWHQISYPDSLNGQSKLLNNFFYVKIFWDTKFHDFLSFLAIF